jgi:hypothetical protein
VRDGSQQHDLPSLHTSDTVENCMGLGESTQQLLKWCGTVAGEAGRAKSTDAGEWQAEPSLGLLPDGLPASVGGTWPEVHNRVAQLKAAGNAIVPEVAAIFMLAILRRFQ